MTLMECCSNIVPGLFHTWPDGAVDVDFETLNAAKNRLRRLFP